MEARGRCPGSHDGLNHDDMSSTGVDLEQLPWTKKIRTIAWLVAVCSRQPGARHSGISSSPLAVERTGAATNTTPSHPPPTPVRPHLAPVVPSRHHQQRESTHRRVIDWEWRGPHRERHGLAAAVPWPAPAEAAIVPEAAAKNTRPP
jgi:hypothetical protein